MFGGGRLPEQVLARRGLQEQTSAGGRFPQQVLARVRPTGQDRRKTSRQNNEPGKLKRK